jgi:hypothetical protein
MLRAKRDLWSGPATVLAAILLAALFLRLHELARDSLWLDEILTVQLSVGRGYAHLDFPENELIPPPIDLVSLEHAPPAWRIWGSLDRDVHPPLFYFVLRAWREMIGDGDLRIRLLSVVLSLGAIVALYLAAEPLHGSAPALWACALMAVAGPQIEYAQEMRSYMLLLIALLTAAAGIVRIEKHGPNASRWLVVGGGVLAALLTHYAAVPALAAMFLYAILRLRARSRRQVVTVFAGAGFVFALTWGPFWLEQMRGFGERIAFTSPADHTAVDTLLRFAELPLRLLTQAHVRPAWVGVFAAVLYVLPTLLLRRRPDLLLWWIWLVGYVGTVTLSDLARSGDALQWIRYTLAASPAAYVLAAAMLSHLPGWRRHLVPVVLTLACLAALPAAYVRWKADWRELATFVSTPATQTQAMLIESTGQDDWRARTLYLCVQYYLRNPALPVAFISEPAPAVVQNLAPGPVVLVSGGLGVPSDRLLPGWQIHRIHYVPYAGTVAKLGRPVEGSIRHPRLFAAVSALP